MSDFNETRIFSEDFPKIHKYQNSYKATQWEMSHSMQTDRWTDMMKVKVAFRNFTNAPNYRMNFDEIC